jgi:hypothetical protein
MTQAALLILVIVVLCVAPGWALLTLRPAALLDWTPLQQWCLAVGLSLAFWPVLFYAVRALAPAQTLGPLKLILILTACAGLIVWRLPRRWTAWPRLDVWEWLALAVFAATLFTRFWIIRDQPYPAWTDSLHHVLLTDLTANAGRLPTTLEPFFPVALGQYHLGLYALSGSVQMLTGLPAHTALLATAQTLNGLCGLGVYLALDRRVGRWGALVGAVIVGLMSFQPAWYVNWGRFTQLASQTLLLIAWATTWETLQTFAKRRERLWWTGAAALLNSAVFLLHFRVAAFYLPLLALTAAVDAWNLRRWQALMLYGLGLVAVGLASLVTVLPALTEALRLYFAAANQSVSASSETRQSLQVYYVMPESAYFDLAARPWLWALAGLSAVWGVWRRSAFSLLSSLWIVTLLALAHAFVLGYPVLNVTNLGAVLIMLYLPIGLLIGAAAEELRRTLPPHWNPAAFRLLTAGLLVAASITGRARATEIEAYRYFVTPADVIAMDWLRANTPADSVVAVNTVFWLPTFPHGVDAGYWIPYFTGRKTTASTMLFPQASPEHIEWVLAASGAVRRLPQDSTALEDLRRLGVDYLYVGATASFFADGLNGHRLQHIDGLRLDYHQDQVWIFALR